MYLDSNIMSYIPPHISHNIWLLIDNQTLYRFSEIVSINVLGYICANDLAVSLEIFE